MKHFRYQIKVQKRDTAIKEQKRGYYFHSLTKDLLGAHVFGTMLGADITKRIKSS